MRRGSARFDPDAAPTDAVHQAFAILLSHGITRQSIP